MKRTLGRLMLFAGPFAMGPTLAATSFAAKHSAELSGPGYAVERWMMLCREPNVERTKRWLMANLSEEIVRQGSVDGLARNEVEFCRSQGGLRVVHKVTSGREKISVVAVGITSGVWFDVSLVENAAGKIAGMHHRVTAPPESELPALKSDAEMADEVRRTVATLSRAGLFSGIVSVARGSDTIVSASGGYSDRSSKAPITGVSPFTLGSLGKMFTAVAIGQLVDQGKVKFDDTVGKFFPDYPNPIARDHITVGMLLSHTAGMGDFLAKRTPEMMKDGVKRASEFMPLYDKDDLEFEPGKGWAYSNAGLALAGAIVEQASGEDYPAYLREHVFASAGMTESDPNNVPVSSKRLVTPYTQSTVQGPSPEWHEAEHDIGSPAGGAISTAVDLVRFADALRNGKLVSKAVFAEMAKPHGTTPWGAQYGYAMEITDTYGRTVVGHGGGFPGVSTHLYIVLDSSYTVVVLANQDPPAADYAALKVAAIVAERAKLEASTSESASERADRTMRSMHEQLETIRANPPAVDLDVPRPDPAPLVGMPQAKLMATLGQPDFCADDGNASFCDQQRHWAYFFFKNPPTETKSQGRIVEVTVTAGGGWALEIDFSDQFIVEQAYWRRQK